MDGNEANSHFSPFCESAYEIVSSAINLNLKIGYTNKSTLKHYPVTLTIFAYNIHFNTLMSLLQKVKILFAISFKDVLLCN
jgi:hypothetical protein